LLLLEDELAAILEIFEERTFSKNEFFKEPFTIRKEFGFMLDGFIRLVIFKEYREAVTTRLLQKNSFIVDILRLCYYFSIAAIRLLSLQANSNVNSIFIYQIIISHRINHRIHKEHIILSRW